MQNITSNFNSHCISLKQKNHAKWNHNSIFAYLSQINEIANDDQIRHKIKLAVIFRLAFTKHVNCMEFQSLTEAAAGGVL